MGIRVAHQLVTPNLLDYIEISKDIRLLSFLYLNAYVATRSTVGSAGQVWLQCCGY